MKEYPVGSVCILVEAYSEYKGKECTIIKGFGKHDSTTKEGINRPREGYIITVQGFGEQRFNAKHSDLKLKKFPGQLQSWLAEKMDKLTQPNPFIVLEEV